MSRCEKKVQDWLKCEYKFLKCNCYETIITFHDVLFIYCQQRFQKCEYAKIKLFKTEGRGWGLLANENIKVIALSWSLPIIKWHLISWISASLIFSWFNCIRILSLGQDNNFFSLHLWNMKFYNRYIGLSYIWHFFQTHWKYWNFIYPWFEYR